MPPTTSTPTSSTAHRVIILLRTASGSGGYNRFSMTFPPLLVRPLGTHRTRYTIRLPDTTRVRENPDCVCGLRRGDRDRQSSLEPSRPARRRLSYAGRPAAPTKPPSVE